MSISHTPTLTRGRAIPRTRGCRRTAPDPPSPTQARGRRPTGASARGRRRAPTRADRGGAASARRGAAPRRARGGERGTAVAQERGGVEGAVAHERLGVDREEGLVLGAQDVAAVEVLVQE